MRIETMQVAEIEPAGYNPRFNLTPDDPEWKRLAAALDEYGMVEPLVWNERTGRLVGGHQRLAILKHKGVETVEVSVVDLDEEREKALNVALNNPNLQSTWDPYKLVELAETMDAHALRIAGFESVDDAHETVRRYELQREGSFLGEFLSQPTTTATTAGYENPLDAPDPGLPPGLPDNGEKPPARQVETDMKEPHKHLSGEQYFEVKLIFDGDQREIWLRAMDRIKQEKGTDNTYDAIVMHMADFNAEWDRAHIEEGQDTL